MKHLWSCCIFMLVFTACKTDIKPSKNTNNNTTKAQKLKPDTIPKPVNYYLLFKNNSAYISKGFDFPVGKPDAKGYYNAQKFRENNHLGDDWNGVGGGNSDLGDAIFSISNGYIDEVKNYKGGWGNVISIIHLYNNKLYKSLYAHCDTIIVKEKHFIKKGEKIATIGNCNQQYYAHLHLELRDSIPLGIGAGYSTEIDGYINPTRFIKQNR